MKKVQQRLLHYMYLSRSSQKGLARSIGALPPSFKDELDVVARRVDMFGEGFHSQSARQFVCEGHGAVHLQPARPLANSCVSPSTSGKQLAATS